MIKKNIVNKTAIWSRVPSRIVVNEISAVNKTAAVGSPFFVTRLNMEENGRTECLPSAKRTRGPPTDIARAEERVAPMMPAITSQDQRPKSMAQRVESLHRHVKVKRTVILLSLMLAHMPKQVLIEIQFQRKS